MKINREQAQKEFTGWLDSKKIKDKKRESNKGSEESIIESIMDGSMIINDDKSITLKLDFPFGDCGELKFKHRITVGERTAACRGLKPDDAEGRLVGYVAALTDKTRGEINKLDSGEDYERAISIAVYFL